jgi:hypothetical protein
VIVCVGGSVALAGAEASPGNGSDQSATGPRSHQVAVANPLRGGTIPPLPGGSNDEGIHFNPITTRARKAKVAFNLPPVVFRSYVRVCLSSASCPGHDLSVYPKLPYPYNWLATYADNWVAVRKHGRLTFGKFPPVRVSMLAFGSIPVSATVHLTQTTHNGFYDPMKLQWTFDFDPIPAGRHVPGFGPAPKFRDPTFFGYVAVVDGTVNVRLSNVVVDQIQLSVGPSCHTSTAASLRLTAPAGYYPTNVPPTRLKGKAGEFQPTGTPAGYLQGSVDVPSFTGCHNGADNLNRLITGMISGKDNPVNAFSPAGLQSWCLEQIAHCSTATTAAQRLVLGAHSATALHRAVASRAGRLAVTGAGSYRPPPAD